MSPATQIQSTQQKVFPFPIDDNQQPNSKDTQKENEKSFQKCREDGTPINDKNSKFCYSLQHYSSHYDVFFQHPQGLLQRTHAYLRAQ